MNTNKKEQLENKYTPSGVTEQLVLPSKDSLRMGASGGIGLVAGTGAKIAKGALNYVKSIFTKKAPVGSGPSRGGNFNEIANQKLREGLNKTKVPKSKPVDFMGPNPANKIGAGGNSYPR